MNSVFETEFFAANRERLRTLFKGTAPIVITANGALQRNATIDFTFRQDSNFWYLTGINEPDIILVMDKQKDYLIVPTKDMFQEAFNGAISSEALTQRSGIKLVFDDREGWKQLEGRLKRVKHVATLAPPAPYLEFYNLYSNPARAALVSKIKDINSGIEPLDLRQHLATMRMVKQPPELAAIQSAIDTTIKTLQQISRRGFSQYGYEYEIEADLTAGYRKSGAAGHAFPPIVASGQNTCIVHAQTNNDALDPKGLIIIDSGAEVENYAADISRTYALKAPTKRQRQVFEAVYDVQQFAYAQLKPGVIIKEYEKTIEGYMGEKLRELGLIKSAEHEAIRQYFPHATSHHLGLDAHDAADYERPLEPNMVVTVEPGIYIPEEGLGVRIEDDVLITASGIEVLSQALPIKLRRNGKIKSA